MSKENKRAIDIEEADEAQCIKKKEKKKKKGERYE